MMNFTLNKLQYGSREMLFYIHYVRGRWVAKGPVTYIERTYQALLDVVLFHHPGAWFV
jgi:hypothetical protein